MPVAAENGCKNWPTFTPPKKVLKSSFSNVSHVSILSMFLKQFLFYILFLSGTFRIKNCFTNHLYKPMSVHMVMIIQNLVSKELKTSLQADRPLTHTTLNAPTMYMCLLVTTVHVHVCARFIKHWAFI